MDTSFVRRSSIGSFVLPPATRKPARLSLPQQKKRKAPAISSTNPPRRRLDESSSTQSAHLLLDESSSAPPRRILLHAERPPPPRRIGDRLLGAPLPDFGARANSGAHISVAASRCPRSDPPWESRRSPVAEQPVRTRADSGGHAARAPRTPVAAPLAPAAHSLPERPRRCPLPAPRTPVATATRASRALGRNPSRHRLTQGRCGARRRWQAMADYSVAMAGPCGDGAPPLPLPAGGYAHLRPTPGAHASIFAQLFSFVLAVRDWPPKPCLSVSRSDLI